MKLVVFISLMLSPVFAESYRYGKLPSGPGTQVQYCCYAKYSSGYVECVPPRHCEEGPSSYTYGRKPGGYGSQMMYCCYATYYSGYTKCVDLDFCKR